jgi:solute carrier family 25 carnitine/acylcarnitine transporter 20/29
MRVLEPNVPKAEQSQVSHIMAGAFAGLVECIVLVPADRVKCLVQADGVSNISGARQYTGTLDCAKQVLEKEGVAGFYKGFGATAAREIPSLGIYFTTYKYISSVMKSIDSPYLNQTVGTVLAGGTAGAMSWLVVYPLDVIKTTIQTGTDTLPSSNCSITGVAKILYKKHGYRVFFKGLGTTVVRAFPVNGITFAVYEKLKVVMDL